jgi:hypothetical protein
MGHLRQPGWDVMLCGRDKFTLVVEAKVMLPKEGTLLSMLADKLKLAVADRVPANLSARAEEEEFRRLAYALWVHVPLGTEERATISLEHVVRYMEIKIARKKAALDKAQAMVNRLETEEWCEKEEDEEEEEVGGAKHTSDDWEGEGEMKTQRDGEDSTQSVDKKQQLANEMEEAVGKRANATRAIHDWERALRYVKLVYPKNVVVLDKQEIERIMPPTLQPFATLVREATNP